MRLLTKDEPASWWNGSARMKPSNLDQVVAADHLQFRQYNGADVTVRGWPKLTGTDQQQWIEQFSDHGLLYLEVQRLP